MRWQKYSSLEGLPTSAGGKAARFLAVVSGHALPTQKIHQAPVLFGRDVDEVAAGVLVRGMGQRECTMNPAFGFELTLDFDPVPDQKGEIGGNLETCAVRSTRVQRLVAREYDNAVFVGKRRPVARMSSPFEGESESSARAL